MTRLLTRRPTGPFKYFLLSRSVSWAGNAVSAVALPILMFQETGSAAMSGLLAVCEAVPYLLFGLPVGALVDRWDQRRTMTVTSWLSAAVTATIPLAAAAGILVPMHLLAVATLLAVLFVFFDAASFGTIPALVGRDGIAGATARMLTVSTVIGIIGPAVGGVLTAAIGGAWVLAIDSASYIAGALILARIHWHQPERDVRRGIDLRAEIAEGISFIRRTPVIRDLTLVGIGNSFTGGAVAGLVVVMAAQGLGLNAGDGTIGLLFGGAAVGSLAAARILEPAQTRLSIGAITLGALALNAAFVGAWAASTTLAAGILALMGWQATNSLVSLNGIVVRQSLTPASLQGRVNTTARMIAWGGQPFGAGIGGLCAELWGVRAALLIAGTGVLLSLAAGSLSSLPRAGTLGHVRAATDIG
ncbi:MFS transporter [Arthrobacter sp. NPDC080031]|uniref:MFS transporter n=1 Tax=Arthrobacter sp. NPDC080031 TaxID=3155918 RepID=UPI00344B8903